MNIRSLFAGILLACSAGMAQAVSYSLTVIVAPEGPDYRCTYSLTEYGPRIGVLQLILPVNILPAQPLSGPVSIQIPSDWSMSLYAPFNLGPANPEILYNGGWYFLTNTANPSGISSTWEISMVTPFAPQTSQYAIKSGPFHPYYFESGQILMPAYSAADDNKPVPDDGSTLPLLLAGLVSCRWIARRRWKACRL